MKQHSETWSVNIVFSVCIFRLWIIRVVVNTLYYCWSSWKWAACLAVETNLIHTNSSPQLMSCSFYMFWLCDHHLGDCTKFEVGFGKLLHENLRSVLFWTTMQHIVVISYWRFRAAYWSHVARVVPSWILSPWGWDR